MKAILGSLVFLISLVLMRQILVGAGVLPPWTALLFVVCVVGIPLGGIVFLESAFESESRRLREDVRGLREEVAELRRRLDERGSS